MNKTTTQLGALNRKMERIAGGSSRKKNKWDAVLYAGFLGGFGVHHFYVGNKRAGLAYLAMCWLLIPFFLAWVQAFEWLITSSADFEAENSGEPWHPDATPATHVKCPDCTELVRKQASVCAHCGTKLIAQ